MLEVNESAARGVARALNVPAALVLPSELVTDADRAELAAWPCDADGIPC